jgi:hypothetical protein
MSSHPPCTVWLYSCKFSAQCIWNSRNFNCVPGSYCVLDCTKHSTLAGNFSNTEPKITGDLIYLSSSLKNNKWSIQNINSGKIHFSATLWEQTHDMHAFILLRTCKAHNKAFRFNIILWRKLKGSDVSGRAWECWHVCSYLKLRQQHMTEWLEHWWQFMLTALIFKSLY